MPKKKTKSGAIVPSSNSPKAVHRADYIITEEPIRDQYYQQLPPHVREAVETFYQKAQDKPREAIPELEKMIEQYPKLPMLYNYLVVAYSKMGDNQKAEAVIQECIQQNPDYLFGRINYAETCLQRKEYDKIAEIFDHKFDLQLLYPKRKKFHISEAANFMGIVGTYFYEIGERETAQKYYEILHEFAPDYPMVRRLKRKLFPNLFERLWKRLRGG
jgi:tetratricopeptide (TPR) repeat protein